MLNLEPIKSRIAEATPGDWRWCGESLLAFTPGVTHLIISADVFEVLPGNAALLAESRTDITALVEEVERLRDKLLMYRHAIASHRGCRLPSQKTADRVLWAVLDA